MSGLEIEIPCPYCSGTHRVPLDDSGHWSGPFPCDASKHGELQIKAEQWRELVGAEREKQVH